MSATYNRITMSITAQHPRGDAIMKTRDVFLGVFLALLAFAAVCVGVFMLYGCVKASEINNAEKTFNLADQALGEEVRFTAGELYELAHAGKLGGRFNKQVDVTGVVVGEMIREEKNWKNVVNLDAGNGKKVELRFGNAPKVKPGDQVHVRGVMRVGVNGFEEFVFWLDNCRMMDYP
jgi:hypothetical protein